MRVINTSPSEWSRVLGTDALLGIYLVKVGGPSDPRGGECEAGVVAEGHYRGFRAVTIYQLVKQCFRM